MVGGVVLSNIGCLILSPPPPLPPPPPLDLKGLTEKNIYKFHIRFEHLSMVKTHIVVL